MSLLPIGVIPPLVIPFDKREDINEEALRQELQYFKSYDIAGLSIGGSSGEGAILSSEELLRCFEIVQEENSSGLPVITGIIRNSVREVLPIALAMKTMGTAGLLITPPFYFGGDEQSNKDYFSAIASEVGIPIVIYNVIPTNMIGPEQCADLLSIKEVVGIKQVDPVLHAQSMHFYPKDKKIFTYSACDFMLYSTYLVGSDGPISALATIVPDLCVEQWDAFIHGDHEHAAELQRRMLPLVQCYLKRPFPGKIKALMQMLGRQVGVARRPYIMPSEEDLKIMRKVVHAFKSMEA